MVALLLMLSLGDTTLHRRDASNAADAAALAAAGTWADSIESMYDDAVDSDNADGLWGGIGKGLGSYAGLEAKNAADTYASHNGATVTAYSVDATQKTVTVSVETNSTVEGTDEKMTATSTAEIVLKDGVCLGGGKVESRALSNVVALSVTLLNAHAFHGPLRHEPARESHYQADVLTINIYGFSKALSPPRPDGSRRLMNHSFHSHIRIHRATTGGNIVRAIVSHTLPIATLTLALLTGCGGEGGESADPSATATSTDAQATETTASLTPAYGLTLTLPTNLTSDEEPRKGSNDKWRVDYYVQDESAPALIDVEYYTENSQTASGIASLDENAYAEDGITITPTATTVEGSPDAYTYTWEQNAAPPWDPTAPAIDLSCQAKLADGPEGYAYGVYACAPKDNQQSIDAMQAVLDSMTVSES